MMIKTPGGLAVFNWLSLANCLLVKVKISLEN